MPKQLGERDGDLRAQPFDRPRKKGVDQCVPSGSLAEVACPEDSDTEVMRLKIIGSNPGTHDLGGHVRRFAEEGRHNYARKLLDIESVPRRFCERESCPGFGMSRVMFSGSGL